MVHAVGAGLDHREAVLARVDVEERGTERPLHVVAEPEAEHVAVEPHADLNFLDGDDDVTHAERPGAKAGDRAARVERLLRCLGTVERLQTVADRVVEGNQRPHRPAIGERRRLTRDRDADLLQPRGQGIKRRLVR